MRAEFVSSEYVVAKSRQRCAAGDRRRSRRCRRCRRLVLGIKSRRYCTNYSKSKNITDKFSNSFHYIPPYGCFTGSGLFFCSLHYNKVFAAFVSFLTPPYSVFFNLVPDHPLGYAELPGCLSHNPPAFTEGVDYSRPLHLLNFVPQCIHSAITSPQY